MILTDLVRDTLRLRPDRVVIGEAAPMHDVLGFRCMITLGPPWRDVFGPKQNVRGFVGPLRSHRSTASLTLGRTLRVSVIPTAEWVVPVEFLPEQPPLKGNVSRFASRAGEPAADAGSVTMICGSAGSAYILATAPMNTRGYRR